ncbi:transcriptional regulator, LysR family [Streptococcus infantarius subsp. infantarius]|uniref:LysR family transcriptional regulator n=1 Tax=Streptococcus TaxID=1301 RepID=UPI000EE120BA|nr:MULTISPECIES: LysR family transcriptional regulator [Streptococcus]MCO4510047.1 transcriptional regulator, LysR family [Streptococcus infantarius subsp. infantarius]MCO4510661.1 transcriptional regulator, LysR family [Streptococcus infantarius subsp. infantarius]MCO4513234.1 transcriptional regulator, LysR family [Streptococcus infantarius subsp. infantarius]MCO4514790.1 transcriptional regulator, LysR family [Streptococcus infantarius subsp. infantarius]MCO4517816.1 transcriptional regulat
MNFQQCRYVEVVARVGSFSQAAKELYMTQPNLSCSIKDLENELGVQLFTRSNTGARLTEDGHDFLKYAKRIIGELDLLQQRYHDEFKKSFTVASHHYDFLSIPLAKVAQEFKQDYQEFQTIETTTKKVLDSVASFEADLGIIYLDDENEHILTSALQYHDLEFTSLGEFPTRVFLRRDHPLAHKSVISETDLKGYNQIRFRQEHSGLNFDEDALDIHDQQRILYSNDRGTVMNLLCATDAYASGLGIVNSFVKDQIVLIPLQNSPKHTLGYVTNRKKKLSDIGASFINEIKLSLEEFSDKSQLF